jgi:hypothetical protein
MAEIIREKILDAIHQKLSSVPEFKTVERRHPNFEDARNFAPTQLPYVGIIGGLPVPVDTGSYQSGREDIYNIVSKLDINILFFHSVSGECDKEISKYIDVTWRNLNEIRKPHERVKSMWVEFDRSAGIIPPMIAFFAIIHVEYLHTIEYV